VLAAALAVAATAKLARGRRRLAEELRAAGLGAGLAQVGAVVLWPVELGVALALVALPGSAIPGAVAVALLVLFTAVLVLVGERGTPCPCFGGTAPAGPRTVVRNGVLAACGVLAAAPVDGAAPSTTLAAGAVLATVVAVTVQWAEEGEPREAQRPGRRRVRRS
jgi:hypothetical protein